MADSPWLAAVSEFSGQARCVLVSIGSVELMSIGIAWEGAGGAGAPHRAMEKNFLRHFC